MHTYICLHHKYVRFAYFMTTPTGSERVDLVDCRSGLILPDVPAQQFWIGFENVRSRLRDQATDEPMLLKLKDWPPTEDFSEKLPRRFEDIMQALPMGDYTRRDGKLNMVSRCVGECGEGLCGGVWGGIVWESVERDCVEECQRVCVGDVGMWRGVCCVCTYVRMCL